MIDNRKINGIHFTPNNLSEFLGQRIIDNFDLSNKQNLTILDPACGEGELLISISKIIDNSINCKFIGYDIDHNHISATKQRFQSIKNSKFEIYHKDFLEIDITNNSFDLFSSTAKQETELADVIIANPPYVRTQVIGAEKAKFYSKKYNIKGRIDLYFPFLISMTNNLKTGGILGVLTSNKYLFTKSGESIRKYLIENYEIIEIIDLGDTKFFEAAVLPAIFIGRKKSINSKNQNENTKFTKIYEYNPNGHKPEIANSIIEILNKQVDGVYKVNDKLYKQTVGKLIFAKEKSAVWSMCNTSENDWVKAINKNSSSKVCDHVKVKIGVKTTADNVFIRDDWHLLNIEKQPEKELLKPLISQDNITKWERIDTTKLKILYPYLIQNGKKTLIDIEKYPNSLNYFNDFKEQLKSRKYLIDAGREWFEIWVAQNPIYWQKPKIVFPDISLYPRFYLDFSGSIVNGNCYWIITENENIDLLYLIQGVANSKLMTKYHDLCFNNKLYSGRRRYFSQYVEKYPLPDLNSIYAQEIIQTVKKLIQNTEKEKISELETILEIAVANAFNVEPVLNLD
jgi:hypothetical protein